MKTLVGQKSSAKVLCGKSSDAPLDESDPERLDLFGNSDDGKDGKTGTNDDGNLYFNFIGEVSPSQMEIDNAIDVYSDS